MSRTSVAGDAPILHRWARWYASNRFRKAPTLWRFVELLRPVDGSYSLEVSGFRLVVDTADYGEAEWYKGLREQGEMLLTSKLVGAGSHCIDIGANLGIYTALLAQRSGRRGRVVAYEPAPWLSDVLQRRFEECTNVVVRPVAVGSQTGRATLSRPSRHRGAASLRVIGGAVQQATVPVVCLDDDCRDDVDFLKVDVEGWEGEVLFGARGSFASRRIRSSLWEVSPQFGSIAWLDELRKFPGYCLFEVTRGGVAGGLRFEPELTVIDDDRLEDLYRLERQTSVLHVRVDALNDIAHYVGRG